MCFLKVAFITIGPVLGLIDQMLKFLKSRSVVSKIVKNTILNYPTLVD